VLVLTSNYGAENDPVTDATVSRSLLLEMEFLPWRNSLLLLTRWRAREAYNLRQLRHTLSTFRPDLVFVWGVWNLPRSLTRLAEELCAGRVVYRFASYWPALPSQYTQYWLAPGRTPVTRVLRRVIRPFALAFAPSDGNEPPLRSKHIICVSEAVKKELLAQGIDVSAARIIYTGLDMGQYQFRLERSPAIDGKTFKLLYSGRLTAEKGVHTIVEAMHELRDRQPLNGQIGLTIAGTGDQEYEMKLKAMVADMALGEHVAFLGHVPYEKMPSLYSCYDVLIVPSVWPEPFARVVLEGMASGLALIASKQGGTQEIIRDGHNGLLFAAGDAAGLANKILALYQEPAKRYELVAAGRQTVMQDFGEERMLDQMEGYLLGVLNNS
jgi:glycosyltransferase involved in cell wall biosynthesis